MSTRKPNAGLIKQTGSPTGIAIVQPAIEAGKGFLSENTKKAYFRDWMDFFGVEDLAKVTPAMAIAVTPDDVADFRDKLLAAKLKPDTVNRKLSSVRAFFDQLILRRVIAVNPAHPKLVRPPKRGGVRKMEAFSQSEAIRFLDSFDRSTPIGRRDYALVMVDLHMGLRRSEALSIRTDQFQVRYDRACIVFRGKGEKERIVTINQDLQEVLSAYSKDRGTEPGWLFPGRDGKPLSGDSFWKMVQKYLKLSGIKKKIGTHGLRATFISTNLAKGTPLDEIQRSVGHSRGETTLGYSRDMEQLRSRATTVMEGFKAGEKEGKS